jgi:hypothetical protein
MDLETQREKQAFAIGVKVGRKEERERLKKDQEPVQKSVQTPVYIPLPIVPQARAEWSRESDRFWVTSIVVVVVVGVVSIVRTVAPYFGYPPAPF